jgi:hypothetical protein
MKDTTTIICEELEDNICIEICYEPPTFRNRTHDYEGDPVDAVIDWMKCDDRHVNSDDVLNFFDLEQLLDNSEIEVNGSEFQKFKAAIE